MVPVTLTSTGHVQSLSRILPRRCEGEEEKGCRGTQASVGFLEYNANYSSGSIGQHLAMEELIEEFWPLPRSPTIWSSVPRIPTQS